jgi:hypothetical protein
MGLALKKTQLSPIGRIRSCFGSFGSHGNVAMSGFDYSKWDRLEISDDESTSPDCNCQSFVGFPNLGVANGALKSGKFEP